MGFTIQDMLIISQEPYQMKLIAGNQGWANSISWVMMLEDLTVINNFRGKELAVTTGLGFNTVEQLRTLVTLLSEKSAAGLIVNTGYYIMDVPEEIKEYCNQNDLPLMTVPWEIHITDMIKDLSLRVFMQESADEQISNAMIKAIESPDNEEAYRKELLPFFDVDGTFQVVLLAADGLDSMDTVERKKLGYRMQINVENLTHNGNFFYYDGNFVIVVNDVTKKQLDEIVERMIQLSKRRMSDVPIYVGIGTMFMDVKNLSLAYHRAKSAVNMAYKQRVDKIEFDNMGIYRMLYAVEDPFLLKEMETSVLAPLLEYDKAHNANYVETLEVYLRCNRSIQAVSEEMYTHRNTILYRINNIKKLIGCDLESPEERIPFQMAYYIRKM
ncbi:MAG: PucR family transcriptional regulator ligand-binding domain-containing protein [Agathobacter sp.]|nr:PucR family transcriptional regulator ligand-binding domain-containing protein [Agathobacter sp.]